MLIVFWLYVAGVVWIVINALSMPKLRKAPHDNPSMSVLVPLRNEEESVGLVIASLQQLRYEQVEFILYDDASTDATVRRAQQMIAGDARFTLLRGEELPPNWRGKPHACRELARAAGGDVLLFIDADVTLHPDTLHVLAATMARLRCDVLSGFPKFIGHHMLERLLTPLLHFFVYMHLPLVLANRGKPVLATAASGAFIAVTRACYEQSGGHALVRDEVVEDVKLLRELKKRGYKVMLCHVADAVTCAMYVDARGAWEGFLKNSFAGLGHSYMLAGAVWLFYTSYYVAPLFLVLYGVVMVEPVYVVPYVCVTLQRLVSDLHARQLNMYSFFMPISGLCYTWLLLTAVMRRLRRKETMWKGRAL